MSNRAWLSLANSGRQERDTFRDTVARAESFASGDPQASDQPRDSFIARHVSDLAFADILLASPLDAELPDFAPTVSRHLAGSDAPLYVSAGRDSGVSPAAPTFRDVASHESATVDRPAGIAADTSLQQLVAAAATVAAQPTAVVTPAASSSLVSAASTQAGPYVVESLNVTMAALPAFTVGQAKTLTVATFADPDGPNNDASPPQPAVYTASINWGDNSTSVGTVSGSTVTGTHTYASHSTFTVAVTVKESGVATGSAPRGFTPSPDATGSASASATAYFAPVAANDAYSLLHDTTLGIGAPGVLANDTDANGLALSAVLVSGPGHGTLSLAANGSFVYTPAAHYTGGDTFVYQASNGFVSSGNATVALTVTDQGPTAADDSYNVAHDQPYNQPAPGVLANDSDPNGDPLTAVLATGPTHGTLALNADGSFTYTPNAAYTGSDSFTYTASDGSLTSNTATVSLTVPDGFPSAVPDFYGVQENTTLSVVSPGVLANDYDPDGDPLSAIAVSAPLHGTLSFHPNGSFTYTPALNFVGTDGFLYSASDNALSNNALVTLTVHATNDAPVANADSYSILHDRTLSVPAAGVLTNDTDANGDPLTAALVVGSGPSHGSLTLNLNGSFTYTPNAGYVGGDSFQYTASDGVATSAPATVTIAITDPNAPVAVADSYNVFGNVPYSALSPTTGVLANDSDADGDVLTAVLVAGSGPSHGMLSLNSDGTFTYTPTAGYLGADSFQYQASDGVLLSTAATVSFTVADGTPAAVDDAWSVLHDTTLSLPAPGLLFNDTDPQNGALTAALATGAQHGTVALNATGSFTYIPNAGYVGADTFTYTASDGVLASSPATVTITVKATNTAPVAVADTYTTAHDQTLSQDADGGVLGNDSDPDGDPLWATLVSGPAHGSLMFRMDGSFTYVPTAAYFGADSFVYRANDGTTGANATVSLTVSNDVPTANPDHYSVAATGTTSVDSFNGVLANDADAEDALTATLAVGPAHGSVSLSADGSFAYTVGNGFTGADSFTYTVNDGVNTSAPATVYLTTGPAANDDSYTVQHDSALTVDATFGLLSNDSYNPGTALQAAATSQPQHGTLSLAGDGSFTFTPTAGYVGADSFTYVAQAGGQNSNTATVKINVVDQAPSAPNDAFAVHGGQTLTAVSPGLAEVATDPDLQDTLTFKLLTAPSHGTLTQFRSDGTFSYQPQTGFVGTDSFTYKTNDGALDSPTAGKVTITVDDQAPIAIADAYDVPANGSLPANASRNLLNNDYDPDADTLTIVQDVAPQHAASFTLNANGTFAYTPATGYTGSDTFQYHLSDGTFASSAVAVSLNVTSQAVAHNDVYYLHSDGSLSVLSAAGVLHNDFSPSGGPLTAQLTGASLAGLTFSSDGSFTYSPPNPGQPPQNLLTFTYQAVANGLVGTVTAVVTLVPKAKVPVVTLTTVRFTNALAVLNDVTGKPFPKGWDSTDPNRRNPLALVRDQHFGMQVTFTVDAPDLLGELSQLTVTTFASQVAWDPDLNGGTVPPTLNLKAGHILTATWKDEVAPDFASVWDQVDLHWKLIPSTATASDDVIPVGATSLNRIYVLYKQPVGNVKLFHTVVHVGTESAANQTSDTDVIAQIISYFQDLSINRVNETGPYPSIGGPVLRYYGDWNALNPPANKTDDHPWDTTEKLLQHADGMCEGWARFFLDTLRVQGITAGFEYKFEPSGTGILSMFVKNWKLTNTIVANPDPNTVATYPYANTFTVPLENFTGQSYRWTGTKSVEKADGEAAQGNGAPLARFANHVVVQIGLGANNTIFFDPSYGRQFPGADEAARLRAWQNGSLDFIGMEFSLGGANRRMVFRSITATSPLLLKRFVAKP